MRHNGWWLIGGLLVAGLGLAGGAARAQVAVPLGGMAPPVGTLERAVDALPAPERPDLVLYDQFADAGRTLIASQQFEPAWADYDAQAADDFTVPGGETWTISTVEVAGSYSTAAHAAAVNIYFYDAAYTPIISQTGLLPAAGLDTGNFSIPINPLTLDAGTYWVSVQAQEALQGGGQWFWRNRSNPQGGDALWRNPADGFGNYYCYGPQWHVRGGGQPGDCILSTWHPDQVFRLLGTQGAPPPTGTALPTAPPFPTPGEGSPIPPPLSTQNVPLTPAPPTSPPTPPVPCDPQWALTLPTVVSPDGRSGLLAVSASSVNDAWAVGYTRQAYIDAQTLTLHWDGTTWTQVPSPNPGTSVNQLYAVSARAANDVWAVGQANNFGGPAPPPLLLHWDGTAWALVNLPAGTFAILRGVVALAANDAWAVGYGSDYQNSMVTLHWDGTTWSAVPTPPGHVQLAAVTAVAANDIWAVGYSGEFPAVGQDVAIHWDGTSWTLVGVPISASVGFLLGAAATGPNAVWAAGWLGGQADGSPETTQLGLWDGSTWTTSSTINPGLNDNHLNALAARGANDVWAVGYQVGATGYPATLTAHWDGTTWSVVPSANNGLFRTTLNGVAVAGGSTVWAVGDAATADASQPVRAAILRYVVGSPFSDVPPDNPFAAAIACLACRGIVNGYADGTFHPYSGVTRGQLSKYISNAAGYTDVIPPGQQTFADVPPGQPFWLFVERAAAHGVINGYTCGGAGEPCPGRYFRPGGLVTRGQTAKFVSNAAGYGDPIPPGQQTFRDVPPGDPFWLWVERVASRGIVTGYACDGATVNPCTQQVEACPGAYFRPCAGLTRGQAAKFVGATFFPACDLRSR